MRQNFGEYLLLLLSVWSVSCVGFHAFFLEMLFGSAAVRAGVALVLEAGLLALMYAAAYRRERVLPGALAYAACLALLVGVALATGSAEEGMYADAEGNGLYFVLVVAFACTGGFLLTRSLTGGMLWFLVCAFACSAVQAFYENGELAFSVASSLSAVALVIYRNFRSGLSNADVAGAPSAVGTLAASAVSAVGAGALALLVWFAVIAPLSPGVLDIKLFTDYRALPVVELKGTAEEQPEVNYMYLTENLVDGFFYTTDDLVEDPESNVVIDASSLLQQQTSERSQSEESQEGAGEGSGSGGDSSESYDGNSDDPGFDPISYDSDFPWAVVFAILAVLAAAGIAGYFVGRRALRRRRLDGLLSLPPRAQAQELYLFLLGRMGRIGFSVPAGQTAGEWTAGQARAMDMMAEVTRVPFGELTRTYEKCAYGHEQPDEEEIVALTAFYLNFWKAARVHLGNVRYFFKSFRL